MGPQSTGQASEVERLQRELTAMKESRAADINEDNLRLISQLTEVQGFLPPSYQTYVVVVVLIRPSKDTITLCDRMPVCW